MYSHNYTQGMLDDAMSYLRLRVQNEMSMEHSVLEALMAYGEVLMRAYMAGLSKYDVELLLSELCDLIIHDCELLAVDEHEHSSEIIAHISRLIGGKSLHERVAERIGTFSDEIHVNALAALLLGKDLKSAFDAFWKSINKPWHSVLLEEVRNRLSSGDLGLIGRMGELGIDSPSFFSPRHYGRGIPVSSLQGVQRIARFAVGEGWMYSDYLTAKSRGAVGFVSVRGSSYPCDICDSQANVFHYLTDTPPPFHLNCMCGIVWIVPE